MKIRVCVCLCFGLLIFGTGVAYANSLPIQLRFNETNLALSFPVEFRWFALSNGATTVADFRSNWFADKPWSRERFNGSYPNPTQRVPEPGTVILLGIGLMTGGLWKLGAAAKSRVR